MSVISDAAGLDRMSISNEALGEAEIAVSAAQAMLGAADDRRSALEEALRSHEAARPEPDPDLTAELSEMLAADPSAVGSTGWAARIRKSQDGAAEALREWDGQRLIYVAAMERVDREIETLAAALAEAHLAHEEAWRNFVQSGREILVDELERQFSALYESVFGPLECFLRARARYGENLVPYFPGQRRVHPESQLTLLWTDPEPQRFFPHGAPRSLRLYPVHEHVTRVKSDQVIDEFRARLVAHGKTARRGRERGTAGA